MLKKLTPNLMVEDVGRTLDFYRDVLGFQVLTTVPPDQPPFNWGMVSRDGVELMFQVRASLGADIPALASAPIGASQTFYIEVEDIDALYAAIKGRVEIVQDMHTTFYDTREFAFRDVNGYILAFSEAASS
jgi:uncharacterized glyoxalase superfamily protein PhnB